MIEHLYTLYPNLIKVPAHTVSLDERYIWFSMNKEWIGIPAQELTDREALLLSSLLDKLEPEPDQLTTREQMWQKWMEDEVVPDKATIPTSFRFVFFSLKEEVNPSTFQEAVEGVFPTSMPILWDNRSQGIIVEEIHHEDQEPVSYEDIVNILMSDFYMKLYLYVSPFYYQDATEISSHAKWQRMCFQTMLQYEPKPVTTYKESIPYLHVDPFTAEQSRTIRNSLLLPVMDDPELIRTVRVFIESQSNATLAAKRLYMHRNSLQYRIDKFIERTGIDIKQFHGALCAYLAILHETKLSNDG
ncbi:hypothetical protein N781_14735 [Pontibacillus halophilus JSM 076056 = DSM 19796]|uniref:PucR C-terminal helix-turn-helix domain-containing protein n=1 Tax=Pontibacillus halophilus JSM 076056 = DSM 19796 TaxID=1385510 RepID=A0A0A5GNM9_9BACI|nr:helix-turn-helix domain-containing protein [Pontibacillus halophilus]KGX92775.1 hypothetical protein N781_14735 [Pontibacillus halophilus JSM 076056 = DSM 19796]